MAHFAELDASNIVLRVLVLDNLIFENCPKTEHEEFGINFLKNLYGQETTWLKTSYNTKSGIYYDSATNEPSIDQAEAFRKNFPSIGYSYDLNRNAFIPPMPSPLPQNDAWELNDFSCTWYDPKAPKVRPTIGVTRV